MNEQTLPPFPVDDATLSLLKEALDTAYDRDFEHNPVVPEGKFSMPRLLDFVSEHSPETDKFVGYGEVPGLLGYTDIPIYEVATPIYSERDVIRALIAEVERLRPPEGELTLDGLEGDR
jgi:hypothetical protein